MIDYNDLHSFGSDAVPPRVCGPGGQSLREDNNEVFCESQNARQLPEPATAED